MADDLGMVERDVHAKAADVLHFWFEEVPPEKRFAKDAALDRQIGERFGALRDAVFEDAATEWRDEPDTLLGAIILLDQFSRNLHRDSAEAFAADPLALELAQLGIREGWETRYPPERRAFLYMPLMHAEDRVVQRQSVDRFTALGDPDNLKFAYAHAGVIERFGRFPSRNAALGRLSTPEEEEFLTQQGAGW